MTCRVCTLQSEDATGLTLAVVCEQPGGAVCEGSLPAR
jgi:hypothetical protein